MELREIKAVIIQADPEAKHYTTSSRDAEAFTVWGEYERIGLMGDDGWAERGWRFEVDHYTKMEFSPVPERIEEALLAAGVAYTYTVAYQQQTGYIRHIFDCEV